MSAKYQEPISQGLDFIQGLTAFFLTPVVIFLVGNANQSIGTDDKYSAREKPAFLDEGRGVSEDKRPFLASCLSRLHFYVVEWRLIDIENGNFQGRFFASAFLKLRHA